MIQENTVTSTGESMTITPEDVAPDGVPFDAFIGTYQYDTLGETLLIVLDEEALARERVESERESAAFHGWGNTMTLRESAWEEIDYFLKNDLLDSEEFQRAWNGDDRYSFERAVHKTTNRIVDRAVELWEQGYAEECSHLTA